MALDDSTGIGGPIRGFRTTRWSLLNALQSCTVETRKEILDLLIRQYWKPVYYYLRRTGLGNEQAKDAVQGFFETAIGKGWFKKADASRGRFRTFLLSSLSNYASNLRRHEQAGIRCPSGGVTSLDKLLDDADRMWEPPDNLTPEDIYHRTWLADLVVRVLKALEHECRDTGKEAHYEIFRRCLVEPIIEGTERPPMRDLADEFGMTEKQANNVLTTARRAYQRLLREEVRTYALSEEDEKEEIRDLFRFVSG